MLSEVGFPTQKPRFCQTFPESLQRSPPGSQEVLGMVKRAKGKKVCIPCSYGKCRKADMECKNSAHVLDIAKVNRAHCRPLRAHTQTVRFCSSSHMNLCRLPPSASMLGRRSGGREALNEEQAGILFHTLVRRVGAPWAGVLCVLQLCLGERVDAARQACASWLQNLDPEASGSPAVVRIPDNVNGKTQSREIQIATCFARLLWGWVQEPLRGLGSATWPHCCKERRT